MYIKHLTNASPAEIRAAQKELSKLLTRTVMVNVGIVIASTVALVLVKPAIIVNTIH